MDKYRPTSLSKLDYHLEQADHLKNMVIIDDLFTCRWRPGVSKKPAKADRALFYCLLLLQIKFLL